MKSHETEISAVVTFKVTTENALNQFDADAEAKKQAEYHLENPRFDDITGPEGLKFCEWSNIEADCEVI